MKKLKQKLIFSGIILAFVIGMSIGGGVLVTYSATNVPSVELTSSSENSDLDTKAEYTYKKYVKAQEEMIAYSLQEVVVTAKVSKSAKAKSIQMKVPVEEKNEVDSLGSQTNDIQPLQVQLLTTPTVDHLIVKANCGISSLTV